MTAAEPLDPERLAAIEARTADWIVCGPETAGADRRALLAEVKRLREQEQRIRDRDAQILSMIRNGHVSEGWGTRAVQDIWAVLLDGAS